MKFTGCLWLYDGELNTHENFDDYHEEVWPDVWENCYRGRFDGLDWISIFIPIQFQHRDLPSSLLGALKNKFPPCYLHIKGSLHYNILQPHQW